jgi:hypothetical protein
MRRVLGLSLGLVLAAPPRRGRAAARPNEVIQ